MNAEIRQEDVGCECSRQQGVVETPQHIGLGISGCQHRLGDQGAGVATTNDVHTDACAVGEGVEDALGGRE